MKRPILESDSILFICIVMIILGGYLFAHLSEKSSNSLELEKAKVELEIKKLDSIKGIKE